MKNQMKCSKPKNHINFLNQNILITHFHLFDYQNTHSAKIRDLFDYQTTHSAKIREKFLIQTKYTHRKRKERKHICWKENIVKGGYSSRCWDIRLVYGSKRGEKNICIFISSC